MQFCMYIGLFSVHSITVMSVETSREYQRSKCFVICGSFLQNKRRMEVIGTKKPPDKFGGLAFFISESLIFRNQLVVHQPLGNSFPE